MSDRDVTRGLATQLEARRDLIADGLAPLGWKAAFGAPSFMERFGLSGPVVGFMTDGSIVPSGSTVDVSRWSKAVAEPEVAVYLGEDLPPVPDEGAVRSAIAAVGPAIELADIDLPLDDLGEIVAGNIFHRKVVLGARDNTRSGGRLDGLEGRVRIGGEEVARTDRVEDLTGRLVAVVARMSRLLGEQGERMRGGEVVICGSIVPPLPVNAGAEVEFELYPLPTISVLPI